MLIIKSSRSLYFDQTTFGNIIQGNKGITIIEYIGEKVRKSEGDKRSAKRIKDYLHSEETGSVYIFELNSKYDIDGLRN